jgi:molybdopterin converting factor small subunit
VCVTIRAEGLLIGEVSTVMTLVSPCTVGEAVEGLPMSRSTGLMILVNGKLAGWGTQLQDGDKVELVPVLGGG